MGYIQKITFSLLEPWKTIRMSKRKLKGNFISVPNQVMMYVAYLQNGYSILIILFLTLYTSWNWSSEVYGVSGTIPLSFTILLLHSLVHVCTSYSKEASSTLRTNEVLLPLFLHSPFCKSRTWAVIARSFWCQSSCSCDNVTLTKIKTTPSFNLFSSKEQICVLVLVPRPWTEGYAPLEQFIPGTSKLRYCPVSLLTL